MSKNIIICCDGTGNEFRTELSKGPDGARIFESDNSNVLRLYTCLRIDKNQVAYYHPGVGTMGDPSRKWKIERWWSKVKGLAFGLGFTEYMADAYRYLMDHYETGDRIYLFGFSRGAYTVRALAGALNLYGLLCSGNEGHLSYLLRMYSDASQEAFKRDHTIPRRLNDNAQSRAFRETFSREVTIHFMGVWDTVSSVGWIWDPVKLLYDGQNPIIRKGRHAISIDERRCFFQAMPWGAPMNLDDPKLPPEDRQKLQTALDAGWTRQDIVQAWFPGVHSDVGGSYKLSQSGPAITAFEWMLEEAREKAMDEILAENDEEQGNNSLLIEKERVLAIRGEPAQSEKGAKFDGIRSFNLPRPEPETYLHESLCGAWHLLEPFPHKYFDQEGHKRWQLEPWPHRREIPDGALMHPSVRARFAATSEPAYRPKNLDPAKIRDLTEQDGPDLHADARQRLIAQKYGVYRTPPKTSFAPATRTALVAAACLGLGAAAFVFARLRADRFSL